MMNLIKQCNREITLCGFFLQTVEIAQQIFTPNVKGKILILS